jgi:hypothetical protein
VEPWSKLLWRWCPRIAHALRQARAEAGDAMTTLPERLQAVIAEMRRAVKGEAVTSVGDWADRLEAAQALQAAPEGGDTMRGVCESADFEADTLTFRMVGAYYAAAGEYVITPTHPAAAHKEPTK